MAYSEMSDDVYISDIPSVTNEKDRALKEDKIVNAAKVMDLAVGNATGNIPVSNGTLCTNLNAQYLGGNLASAFAPASHTHTVATSSSNGLMSNTDYTKLSGIASGAEVNQSAFSNLVVGSTTIAADAKTDTLTLTAGSGITLTGDATNDAVTIAVTSNGHTHSDATTSAAGFMTAAMATKLNGVATGAQVNQSAFANVVANGVTVAADLASDTLTLIGGTGITLTGDATNDAVTIAVTSNGHTHSDATTSAAGFMTPTMVTKLNGIATGAEVNQSAFGNVLVGSTTIAADAETDTLELAAGTNIALTADSTNDKVTIAVTGTVPAATTATTCTGNAATATTLATARTIGISGDATGTATSFNGSNNITIPLTLGLSGATAGTYKSVTVDAKGRVTAGTNPTTLAGYGITDAVSSTGTAANSIKVGGYSPALTNTASTVAIRDTSGDLVARLFRSEYTTTTGGTCAYILGQNAVGSGVDNYARPIPLATLKSALDNIVSPSGKQLFTSSGTFTVPAGITTVWVTMCGGGGGGASGTAGGGAACALATQLTVTPGTIYNVTVGGGGLGAGNAIAGTGGASSFGALLSCAGGGGGSGVSFGSYVGASGGFGGQPGEKVKIPYTGAILSAKGGDSMFGSGAQTVSGSSEEANPGTPTGYGAGGGGGYAKAGNAGTAGFVLVEW
ncbi:beta strand repeat-containing protein [Sporomusa sp.]|uniref:beta strand repeat-containing protein n=1 Tax=Sporomusa sp. TaxID=2078658 RepID=UPI002C8CD010|nr:hypothetical protein [Sporomusa sp.]HWR42780.1 hypothetical protein [Sporomusa sp.]